MNARWSLNLMVINPSSIFRKWSVAGLMTAYRLPQVASILSVLTCEKIAHIVLAVLFHSVGFELLPTVALYNDLLTLRILVIRV